MVKYKQVKIVDFKNCSNNQEFKSHTLSMGRKEKKGMEVLSDSGLLREEHSYRTAGHGSAVRVSTLVTHDDVLLGVSKGEVCFSVIISSSVNIASVLPGQLSIF